MNNHEKQTLEPAGVTLVTTALAKWDQLKQAVIEAHSIDELRELRDKAEALRQYTKRQKESLEMQNKFAEITLRCERRAGEMLREMPKNEGGRPAENRSHDGTGFLPNTLSDLGITKNASSRWQAIASLPEETFEQYISKTKNRQEEITTGGCIKVAKQYKQQLQQQVDPTPNILLVGDVPPTYTCAITDFHVYVATESVDAIITDPPYPREFLSVYDDLADFAIHALKPGGSLIVMVGQSYLPEILEKLCKEPLTYHWLSCYYVPGATTKQWQRNLGIAWKPLLWFVKGEYVGPWRKDVIRDEGDEPSEEESDEQFVANVERAIASIGRENIKDEILQRYDLLKHAFIGKRKDKNHHEWGQPVDDMVNIIEHFTQPDQIICDPFVGGGSTGVAAVRSGRRFIGCDIKEDCVITTRQRIQEEIARQDGQSFVADR